MNITRPLPHYQVHKLQAAVEEEKTAAHRQAEQSKKQTLAAEAELERARADIADGLEEIFRLSTQQIEAAVKETKVCVD